MALESYRDARRQLKLSIRRTKAGCWKRFLNTLQRDPWGTPYRWIMNKLGGGPGRQPTDKATLNRIAGELFPTAEVSRGRAQDNDEDREEREAQCEEEGD